MRTCKRLGKKAKRGEGLFGAREKHKQKLVFFLRKGKGGYLSVWALRGRLLERPAAENSLNS